MLRQSTRVSMETTREFVLRALEEEIMPTDEINIGREGNARKPRDAPKANTTTARGEAAPHAKPTIPPDSAPLGGRPHIWRRRLLLGGVSILVLAAALYYGVPWVELTVNTVSTDDAYVNGHVTFVAARVPGQVVRVLVDDNNRVHKGDLLVQLDKQPYQVLVKEKKAVVATARADLLAAQALARSIEAQARSQRWKLQHAMEDVDNQIALLHAKVAALDSQKAILTRAQDDFDRAKRLVGTAAISQEEFDQRRAALLVAKAKVNEALENVYEFRFRLGLPARPAKGDLTQVPPDLGQTYSTVRQAQADLIQSASQLGVIHSYAETPKQMLEEFRKRAPGGDIDRLFAQLVKETPAVQQAEAKLLQAQSALEQAELNLQYCDVIAEIDGIVTRRDVNPGNNVTAGQSLMTDRSLTEIWIDANFKETQLAELRIGQRVKVEADMYGKRKEFGGRITGFTMGTGQTLALLPPQNATGNFVKIVERLPVRIELTNYNPDTDTLFVGLSCTPYVYYKEPPTGPNAGKLLQPFAALPQAPTETKP
jgi:membrane fusion protein (multidrug efflux system)